MAASPITGVVVHGLCGRGERPVDGRRVATPRLVCIDGDELEQTGPLARTLVLTSREQGHNLDGEVWLEVSVMPGLADVFTRCSPSGVGSADASAAATGGGVSQDGRGFSS